MTFFMDGRGWTCATAWMIWKNEREAADRRARGLEPNPCFGGLERL